MRLTAVALAAATMVLVGGCSLISGEPEPAVEHGLKIPTSEELAAAVDDAASEEVWAEAGAPEVTTAPTIPPADAPVTTVVDPRHAFAQAGAAICQDEFAAVNAMAEPVTVDEKIAGIRAVATAMRSVGDRLAGLTAPDGATQGHLDEAVSLFRQAGELMDRMADVALQGDQAGVDGIQAELQTTLAGMGRAVTAAGIPSCR